jgi:transcriptional regulator with XRE-family HTH domain
MPNLRDTRLNEGLTMQQLIDKSGLTRATVRNAEKGINISYVSSVRIVKALNELCGKNYTMDELEISVAETKDAS